MMAVGFIGLGRQGKPIAVNLAKAGFDLTVCDLRREPCEELAALGARVAASPKEVAARSSIVEIAVVDDAQVTEVMSGPNGVLAGASPGSVVAIHSTIRPATVLALAQTASATGVDVIDAPVSGGQRAAAERKLCYMVGGGAATIERCRPLFETSSQQIFHLGPVGSGLKAKLCQEVMAVLNLMSAHEGLSLGKKAGLPRAPLHEVIHASGGQSRIADHLSDITVDTHALGHFLKDAQMALELADEVGLALPVLTLARQLLPAVFAKP